LQLARTNKFAKLPILGRDNVPNKLPLSQEKSIKNSSPENPGSSAEALADFDRDQFTELMAVVIQRQDIA